MQTVFSTAHPGSSVDKPKPSNHDRAFKSEFSEILDDSASKRKNSGDWRISEKRVEETEESVPKDADLQPVEKSIARKKLEDDGSLRPASGNGAVSMDVSRESDNPHGPEIEMRWQEKTATVPNSGLQPLTAQAPKSHGMTVTSLIRDGQVAGEETTESSPLRQTVIASSAQTIPSGRFAGAASSLNDQAILSNISTNRASAAGSPMNPTGNVDGLIEAIAKGTNQATTVLSKDQRFVQDSAASGRENRAEIQKSGHFPSDRLNAIHAADLGKMGLNQVPQSMTAGSIGTVFRSEALIPEQFRTAVDSHATVSDQLKAALDPTTAVSDFRSAWRKSVSQHGAEIAGTLATASQPVPDEVRRVETVSDFAPATSTPSPTASTSSASMSPAANAQSAAAIAQQLATAVVSRKDNRVELSLNPAELGRVRMSIQSQDGSLALVIHVERPETADLMRRHVESLAAEFRELGYSSLSFDISSGGEQSKAQDESPPSQLLHTSDEAPSANPSLPMNTATGRSGGIDLKV